VRTRLVQNSGGGDYRKAAKPDAIARKSEKGFSRQMEPENGRGDLRSSLPIRFPNLSVAFAGTV
jgi:hypothetical protein